MKPERKNRKKETSKNSSQLSLNNSYSKKKK